jgi:hypothetical protein
MGRLPQGRSVYTAGCAYVTHPQKPPFEREGWFKTVASE